MEETIMDMRGIVARGVVVAVNDAGQAQTVDVRTADGVTRSGIEVASPWGIASNAPLDGATVLLLAVGGDVGDLMALPVSNPARRFGGMAQGESVLYGADGSRIAVRTGGTIQILAATELEITVPGVTITATAGVTITANVAIIGDLDVSGDISDGHGKLSGLRAHYDAHDHVDSRGGTTSGPTPTD
jgi:phage baseplate assembly protein V